MTNPLRVLVMFTTLVVAPPAWGQQNELSPDRPGVGTNADTVSRGVLQLETGLDYARERRVGEPTQRRTSLATTLRYGLLDNVELRLDGEPIVALRGADDATNVGDFVLGAKLRFLESAEDGRPSLAILPLVKLPTAPDPIGSERVDFTLLGLASFDFGRVALDLNAGIAAIAQRNPSGYLVQGVFSGGLGIEVVENLTLLGELFYNTPSERDGDDVFGAVLGVSYLLTKDIALDTAVITALAGRGPDYRIQAGITVRFWP